MLDGLRLPDAIRACLFDMDGVLTNTARLHAAAWKQAFDAFLTEHGSQVLFDPVADYDAYVDGKSRYSGAASFVASRHIDLPEGVPSDPPDAESVNGLANRKNEILLRHIREEGVTAYPGSLVFVRAAREAGLGTAVVSSSANTHQVLDAAGIDHYSTQ